MTSNGILNRVTLVHDSWQNEGIAIRVTKQMQVKPCHKSITVHGYRRICLTWLHPSFQG
jgi:hypothetical protein